MNKKRRKKSLFQKVNQLNTIISQLEEEIVTNEKIYKDLITLSLDYQRAVEIYGYMPAHNPNEDLQSIYLFSQEHIKRCAKATFRLERIINFAKKHRLSFFVSTKTLNGYKSFL